MLFVTGLVTLLAISHAGGDHIKGGSHHIKSSSPIAQEKVAQEDIAYGRRVTIEEVGDSDGRVKGSYKITNPRETTKVLQYHADSTGFYSNVKTSEPNTKTHSLPKAQVDAVSKTAPGKPHHQPRYHPAASIPVTQDQVTLDDPFDGKANRGIKTLIPSPSRKSSFSSEDTQIRNPTDISAIQSVKTTRDPTVDASKGIKTIAVVEQSQFSLTDQKTRDPISRPVTKSVKSIKDTSTPVTKSSIPASTKTIGSKTRVSTSGTKSSAAGSIKYQTDSRGSSSIPESVALAGGRNKIGTSSLTYTSSSASSGRSTLKDGEQISTLYSGEPQEAGIRIITEKGEITLSEDTIQNMGGIIDENGALILSEEAMQMIQNMGGSSFNQPSSVLQISSGLDQNLVRSIPRATGLRQRQPVRNQIRPVTTDSTTILSSSNTRSGLGSYQGGVAGIGSSGFAPTNVRRQAFSTSQAGQVLHSGGQYNRRQSGGTVLFNGKEISIDELREGQIFDENLKPILSSNAGVRTTQSGTLSSRTNTAGLSDSSAGGTLFEDKSRKQIPTMARVGPTTGQSISSSGNTVLFNGKEISIDQIREGQLFDENLKPILSGDKENIIKDAKISGATQSIKPATAPRSQSGDFGSRTRTTQGSRSTGTAQTISSFGQGLTASRQYGQSFTSSGGSTVLFNGKEISIDEIREGQIFDENLKPILSIDSGSIIKEPKALIATQGTKPVTASRAQSGVFTSRSSAGQGSRSTIFSGSGQGDRSAINSGTGPATASQGTRSRVSTRVQSGYIAGQAKPATATAQTTSGFSQGLTATRQSGQSFTSSSGNTVLFNGKEISIDQIREGQLFDENLKPILSGDKENIIKDAKIPGAIQGIKPVTSQSGGFASRTRTAQGTRSTGTAQAISSFGQGLIANRQYGQSFTSSGRNTVLFNGKEISIDQIREGQIFDENLKPILTADSGNIIKEPKTLITTQGTKPVTASRSPSGVFTSRSSAAQGSRSAAFSGYGQGDRNAIYGGTRPATTSQGSRVTTRVDSRYISGQTKPVTGTTQTTSTGNTVLFNGKEISIDQIREGQVFDENLKPILSVDAGNIKEPKASWVTQGTKPATAPRAQSGAFISRTSADQGSRSTVFSGYGQGDRSAIYGATRPTTTSQGTNSRVSTRVDSRRVLGQTKPLTGSGQTATSFGGVTDTRQLGQSFSSSSGNTVLFNGKEISIDQIREGQIFDENLKPILSVDPGNIIKVPKSPVATQSTKPVAAQRVAQSGAFLSRTSTAQGSISPVVSGFGQRDRSSTISERRPTTSTLNTRSRVSNRVDSRYVAGQRIPVPETSQFTSSVSQDRVANRLVGESFESNDNTVLFNGKEISIDELREGQMFDENLRPILSLNTGSLLKEGDVSVASQGTRPATRSRIASNDGASLRTNFEQGSTATFVSGSRQDDINRGGSTVRAGAVSQTGLRSSTLGATGISAEILYGIRGSQDSVGTVLFNGKEIKIDGLKAGQIFDENLQPITEDVVENPKDDRASSAEAQTNLRSPVLRTRQGSSATGLRLDQSDASAFAGNLRSRVSPFSSDGQITGGVTTRGTGLFYQGGTSRTSPNTSTGFQTSNQRTVPNYPPVFTNRGFGPRNQRNQGQVGQEVSQDEIETKIIHDIHPFELTQENVDVQQEVIQHSDFGSRDSVNTVPSESVFSKVPTAQLSQTFLDSTASEQTQLKVEDVQENVPVVLESKSLPKSVPKTTVTQVRKKNNDVPATQQHVYDANFSEYVPKSSYIPPLNYGVPQISPLKAGFNPQEQQILEQVFA